MVCRIADTSSNHSCGCVLTESSSNASVIITCLRNFLTVSNGSTAIPLLIVVATLTVNAFRTVAVHSCCGIFAPTALVNKPRYPLKNLQILICKKSHRTLLSRMSCPRFILVSVTSRCFNTRRQVCHDRTHHSWYSTAKAPSLTLSAHCPEAKKTTSPRDCKPLLLINRVSSSVDGGPTRTRHTSIPGHTF